MTDSGVCKFLNCTVTFFRSLNKRRRFEVLWTLRADNYIF
jgi:hypothetical protein